MSRSHKGSRLSLRESVHAVDFNSTHFDFNHDATGIHMGDLVEPTGTPICTMRPSEGKFGGGVAIEEGTTNVVTNTNLDTGWSKGYCTSIRWNDIEPPIDNGSNVVSFIDSDTNKNAYWYSYGDYAPQVQGEEYTVSMYIKTIDSNFRIKFYTANNSELGRYNSEYIGVPNDGKWHRIIWNSFVNPLDSESDSLSFHFTFGSDGESQRTWFCSPQMENKPFATSFVDGNRTSGSLSYDTKNNSSLTISLWAKSGQNTSRTYIYDCRKSSYEGFGIHTSETNKITFFSRNSENTTWNYLNSNDIVYDNEWHMITSSIEKISDTTYIKKLHTDGVLQGSEEVTMLSFGSGIHLGTRYLNEQVVNGLMSDVIISSNTYSDEEIESWYISQKPFYNPYDYRSFTY